MSLSHAAGMAADDALLFADALVDADLHGVSTHGVSRLSIYLRRIELGLIDPRATLRVERQRAGTLALDAANGVGHVQAVKALDMLIPMAKQNGIAVCHHQELTAFRRAFLLLQPCGQARLHTAGHNQLRTCDVAGGRIGRILRDQSDCRFLSDWQRIHDQDRSFHIGDCARQHHRCREEERAHSIGVGAGPGRRADHGCSKSIAGNGAHHGRTQGLRAGLDG